MYSLTNSYINKCLGVVVTKVSCMVLFYTLCFVDINGNILFTKFHEDIFLLNHLTSSFIHLASYGFPRHVIMSKEFWGNDSFEENAISHEYMKKITDTAISVLYLQIIICLLNDNM